MIIIIRVIIKIRVIRIRVIIKIKEFRGPTGLFGDFSMVIRVQK